MKFADERICPSAFTNLGTPQIHERVCSFTSLGVCIMSVLTEQEKTILYPDRMCVVIAHIFSWVREYTYESTIIAVLSPCASLHSEAYEILDQG